MHLKKLGFRRGSGLSMLSITSRALVSRSILVQKYREIRDFLIPGCKVDGRLLRVLDGLGRAAAGAVKAAAASVHVEGVNGAMSLRRRRSAARC